MMKNNSGVTLIALVITIIVLLILAGVSIATLMGPNGIINNAKQTEIDNAAGDLKEAVSLAISELRIDEATKEGAAEITATTILTKAQEINPRFKTDTEANDIGNKIVYTFKNKAITAAINLVDGTVTVTGNK